MIARLHAALQLPMTTRLVIGFLVLMLVTLTVLLTAIGMVMRQRMYYTTDQGLRNQADTLRSFLRYQEESLAHEAALIASLDGIGDALDAKDKRQLNRLIIPVAISRELDSMYVIDGDREILFRLGDPITHDTVLPRLPLVERGFDFLAASSPLESDGILWLTSAAAHRSPKGKRDAVFLLGKRLDREYLQAIHTTLGSHVALLWDETMAYSFENAPPELSLSHLRASRHEIAEYHEGDLAFHDAQMGDMPYRVAAFTFPARDGGYINAFLFQPTALLMDSLTKATTGVIALGLLLMVFGSLLAYIYARGVTGPLNRLAHAASAIANENLEHTVKVENRDEIGKLAQAFEEMRVRVRAMLQAQQRWGAELEDKVRAKTAELETLVADRDQLLRRTIAAQEEERRRVARELHDETSQALTALIANLAAAQTAQATSPQMNVGLGELKAASVKILQEVNRIVLDLRPTLLDDYGLIAALSWYAENRLEATGTRVQISTIGDAVRLPPTVETALFRIGQEALSNITKYAQAKHVQINFIFENGVVPPHVTLQIEDDGCGFDVTRMLHPPPGQRPSFGLLGMQERVSLIGGQIEMRSVKNKGTCLCVTVPLDAGTQEEGQTA